MLTSYLVRCPNPECGWSGSLLPSQDQNSWREAIPTTNVAFFQCPQCQHSWCARIRGDEVVPFLEEEQALLV